MKGYLTNYVFKNHVPVSQANWCNMTFTAGYLFPSHWCDLSQAPLGFKLGSRAQEVYDLPSELSLPLFTFLALAFKVKECILILPCSLLYECLT